jgi:CPA2 family monovalent cation:H+ antiporter-2
VMIGITLVEDLAVVVLTVVLPTLKSFSGQAFAQVGLSFGKALAIILPVAVVAAKVVPPLMQRVARTANQELFVLVAVSLGFATAALTRAMGLSLALGGFLAGVIISGSDCAHETLSKLLPLRDVFVAIFFVTIGALINPRVLGSEPLLLVVLVGLIVICKFLIWFGVVSLFRYSRATALLVGVGLTQIGEFSYVLVQVARSAEVVSDRIYNATLMASLLSIVLNAFLVRMVPACLRIKSATPAP